jgi:hypothetical protein
VKDKGTEALSVSRSRGVSVDIRPHAVQRAVVITSLHVMQ